MLGENTLESPIDPKLEKTVSEIEKSRALRVLAARFVGYPFEQTPVEVGVQKTRGFSVLEEFTLRAANDLDPAPTRDDLAQVLGLDRLFVDKTVDTLRALGSLELEAGSERLRLTPVGERLYQARSVPERPETHRRYLVIDPLNPNPWCLSEPLQNSDGLENLFDCVATAPERPNAALAPEETQALVEESVREAQHTHLEQLVVTVTSVGEPTQITRPAALFWVEDRLERRKRVQVRFDNRIAPEAGDWLEREIQNETLDIARLFNVDDEDQAPDELPAPEEAERLERLSQLERETLLKGVEDGRKSPREWPILLLRDAEIRPAFLHALRNAKRQAIIFSPWIERSVVNDEFIKLLQKAAQRGVTFLIGYGIGATEAEESRPVASDALERLREDVRTPDGGPATAVLWLGNTHSKEVIVDEETYFIGSHNWLSYAGRHHLRGESVMRVTDQEEVKRARNYWSERFENRAKSLLETGDAMEQEMAKRTLRVLGIPYESDGP